jgi:hypothetical protein
VDGYKQDAIAVRQLRALQEHHLQGLIGRPQNTAADSKLSAAIDVVLSTRREGSQ